MIQKALLLFIFLAVLFGCSKTYVDVNGNVLPFSIGYSVEFVEQASDLYEEVLVSTADLSLKGTIGNDVTYKLIKAANPVFTDLKESKKRIDIWYMNLVIKKSVESDKSNTYKALVQLRQDMVILVDEYNYYIESDIVIPDFMDKEKIDYMFGIKHD